jgi:hypothetical protein
MKAEPMNDPVLKLVRCAIYTRKSSEHNLDLAFTSLDAQREACEAYIRSQAGEGWRIRADDIVHRNTPLRLSFIIRIIPARGNASLLLGA